MAREEVVPAECAEAEAGEVGTSSGGDQWNGRALQRPTGAGQTPRDEETSGDRKYAKSDATDNPCPVIQRLDYHRRLVARERYEIRCCCLGQSTLAGLRSPRNDAEEPPAATGAVGSLW